MSCLPIKSQTPVAHIPVVPENFDPMAWLGTVTALDANMKIDGSLQGLKRETQRFKQLIVEKIPYMKKHYSSQFPTFDKMENRIIERYSCLEKTLESVLGYTKSCEDINRNLDDATVNLDQVGDLCVFRNGISSQIMKLNHVENLLSKTLTMIGESTPHFKVDVNDTDLYDRMKSDLVLKHKAILEKLEYKMARAKANEDRYASYETTHKQICSDRDRLYSRINDFSSTLPNTGLNDQNSVVQVR